MISTTIILNYAWIMGLLPLAVGFFQWKSLNTGLRFIFYNLVLILLIEIGAKLMKIHYGNNLPLLHLFTLGESVLYGLYYRFYLHDFVRKPITTAVIIAFGVYSAINSLFIQSIYEFNNVARGVESLLMILFAILYFMKVLSELKIKRLEREPAIWINAGILFYFSANLFNFIFSNLTLQISRDLSMDLWVFHAVFNWLLYILIAIGLWMVPKKQR